MNERQETDAAPQRAKSARETLKGYFGRLGTQRALVVLALALAVGFQYYLVNMPVADLSQTTKFSPATVKASDQAVSFTNPETEPGHFAFAYDQPAESQKQRVLVDAYFDKASLSEETAQRFASLGTHAPFELDTIGYTTEALHNGTCATAIHVETVNGTGGIKAVQFSQREVAASDRHRLLEVKIAGFDASVTLSSRGSFSNNNSSPCKINLRVGKWQQATAGFIPIKVRVPAGSSFRFRWDASDIQPLGFSTPGPLLSLFEFGNSRRQSFHATEVRIAPALPAGASVELGLVAQSEQKEVPLTVSSFLVGTDQLQFGASGRGRVLEDGKIITTANVIDAINRYPLIAALFAAANLGLLNWAKRKFFPPRGVGSKSVIQFPKETPPEDGSPETDGKKAG